MPDIPGWAVFLIGIFLAILVAVIIGKIVKSLILGILVAIVVSIIFTVTFGDGRAIVHAFTSFLDDDIGQQIEEGYEYYKSKEEQDPYLDMDKISEQITNVFHDAIEVGGAAFFD